MPVHGSAPRTGLKTDGMCWTARPVRVNSCVPRSAPARLSASWGQRSHGKRSPEEAVRDRKFYESSGGGVTFSGGEPTMQPEFLTALARASKAEGLHTAIETSGCCAYPVLQALMPYVDLFLYDWKETDPEKHRQYTGVGNELLRNNLIALHDAGARILLRCPIICGLNDRDDHFQGIAELFFRLPNLVGVEILPYHQLAASKSGRMGLKAQQIYDVPSDELKRPGMKNSGALA